MTGPGSPRAGARFAPASPWTRAPRGATAVIVAICLALVGAFLALALNVGHLFSVKGELQNAADSAALAGAQDLDGSMVPITSTVPLVGAIATGSDYAQRHATDTKMDIQVNTGDVELGYWNPQARTFTSYSVASITPELASCQTVPCVNAVRAHAHRDPAHGGDVPLAFGALLGPISRDLAAEAIAVTGGPCGMKCIGLPIVLPDCGVQSYLGPPCVGGEYKVLFKSANTDTGAWADLGSGANTVKCLLEESLKQSGTQTCSADTACKVTSSLAVLVDVEVINGQINSACDLITQLHAQRPDAKYVVPIVDANCPPPPAQEQWVQSWNVLKFATVQISWAPPDCSAQDKWFKVRILCDEVTNQASAGGCAAAGTWVRPGLVR